MRFREIFGGLRISLSNEENKFVQKLIDNEFLHLVKLSERDRELARLLTTKGVAKLAKIDGEVVVKPNLPDDLGDLR